MPIPPPPSPPPGTVQPRRPWLAAAWQWLTKPSPQVVAPDQRRQAQLLAALLIVIIPLGVLSEVVTIFTITLPNYTGYITTFSALAVVAVAYVLSRTARYQWGVWLTIGISSVAVFAGSVNEPAAVAGGFLDFLFVPLLLASVFLPSWQLLLYGLANLVAMLLLPVFVPSVPLDTVVVGPLIFFLLSATIILAVTRHRDQLERDRLATLRQAEARARQEAARTTALLRVSERLNTQLELNAVLSTVCEETALALGAPVVIIFLYDEARDELLPASSVGVPPGTPPAPALPRALHDRILRDYGPVALLPDVQAAPDLPGRDFFAALEVHNAAYAILEYETRLVGGLAVAGRAPHTFTDNDRLLLSGLAHQAALSIVTTRLYKDARRRLERLQALRTIDVAIASNRDLRSTLEVLLEQICQQLGVDAALVLLLDTAQQRLVFAAGQGFRTQALHATRLRLGDGHAGQAALRRALLPVPDLAANPGTFARSPLLEAEGFASYCAAPLIAKDEVRGVVEVFHRAPLTFEPEWLAFLEALAGQAAIAIDNTTLVADLQHSNAELAQAYDATIEGWSHALDLRDKETEGHTQRVTELTLALARQVGAFDEPALVHVRRGALLHDIGKMGVPDSILLKPGPLSEAEWVIMRRHPIYAYEMLRPIEYLLPALDIPYCHHEKWDGTGYPRGFKGEQIPLAARLFAVVDIWDALRSDRPYRLAWPEAKVRAHLAELAGSHLDPHLVAAFLGMLGSHKME